MAIRTVVTRGYSNGAFNGTIALVSTRGYLGDVDQAGTRRQRQIKSLIRAKRRKGRRC